MIKNVMMYHHALVTLGHALWLEDPVTIAAFSIKEYFFLEICIVKHFGSDEKAAKALFGPEELVSARYRMFLSRLTPKLEAIVVYFAHAPRNLTERHLRAMACARTTYVANVCMRAGAIQVGLQKFFTVKAQSVLPETAWLAGQASFAIALTKSFGSDKRTAAKALAAANDAASDMDVVMKCDLRTIQINNLRGVKPSNVAKRKVLALESRTYLQSVDVTTIGICGTTAASRLAIACSQALSDRTLSVMWSDRYKAACVRCRVWTPNMRVEYHTQRILLWESLEDHKRLLTEIKQLQPLISRNEHAWVQVTDSLAKTLIKLGRFKLARTTLEELVQSATFEKSHENEQHFTMLRLAYVRLLTDSKDSLSMPSAKSWLESHHGMHSRVLQLIIDVRSGNLNNLSNTAESLRKLVLSAKLGRSDKALHIFTRIIVAWSRSMFDLKLARKQKSFLRLESRLAKAPSAGVPMPIVPWQILWEEFTKMARKSR